MKKSLQIPGLWLGALLLLLLAGPALYPADVVTLRDGRVFEGKVIEEGEETIVFQREGRDPINIHLGLVDSIEYAEGRPRSPGEAEEFRFLAGRDYLDAAREAMKSAQNSIRVMMFFSNYSSHSRNAANILISELEAAKKRGLEVEIILETSHTEIVNRGNRASAERLLEGGIEAMFYPTFPVMHVKLVLIDDEVSIVGSHNWTNAAAYSNSESSALVRCPQTARRFREYFSRARARSTAYREIKQREEQEARKRAG